MSVSAPFGGGAGLSPGGSSGGGHAGDKGAKDAQSMGQLPLDAGVHYLKYRSGPLSGGAEGVCGPP